MRAELARVGAGMRFVGAAPTWGLGPVPRADSGLERLAVEGALLEPREIHAVGVILESSRLAAAELRACEAPLPELATTLDRLVTEKELEEVILRSVDDEGQVRDSASRELGSIRKRLRGAHARIVRRLEATLRELSERFVVPDASVTIREGRYVIPVRREGRGEVGGIVHDESQTGATLFVEPPAALQMSEELRDLEREEAREIRRVLGELTARIAADHHDIADAADALIDFDSVLARARRALGWEAEVPEIADSGERELTIVGGRHPLLLEGEDDVVPFDLELLEHERCLVVSGPNTGGKSVLLKAVGLIAALAQCGVVPPVGSGTRLPLFHSFFADIGDEQSIARSLSTFSAHLVNMSELIESADEHSLVLIDEMGTGTDPAEGAALARASLEELVRRGATVLATSHLGDLKQLDVEGSGIVNASLQFDPRHMAPTYRLVKGRPGRSYGLAIARRLGFPPSVLDVAEGYRTAGAATLEDLLERLEEQEARAEQLVQELDRARADAEVRARDVAEREAELTEAERTASERAREEARKLLMDARAEVEDAIAALKGAVESGESVDEAARTARRKVESAARRQRSAPGSGRRAEAADPIGPGDHVAVRASGARGRVAEVRDDRVVVEVGALRLELPATDLELVDPPAEPTRRRGGWTGPAREGLVRTEVDLRGMRVAEVGVELERALDHAIFEELSELRIIHGKGTGALRQRVSEILEADRRVGAFRMGGPGEGGAGVTVASLGGGA